MTTANKSDMNNPKNWKRTQKKNYNVYVCMPKLGSKVTNRLEGAQYVTDENKRFVISGTVGETCVIDANKLAKTYCFIDGQPLTQEALISRIKAFNSDGTSRGNGTIKRFVTQAELDNYKQKTGKEISVLIDWMHLKTLPGGGGINWAFHLPLSIKNFPVQTSWGDTLYANRDGVEHGTGDFLVCADAGGQPNFSDVWVVNGAVFPTTYDMRAFPGLGGGAVNKETPKPKSILGSSTVKKVASTASPVNNNLSIKTDAATVDPRMLEYTRKLANNINVRIPLTNIIISDGYDEKPNESRLDFTIKGNENLIPFIDLKLTKETVMPAMNLTSTVPMKPATKKQMHMNLCIQSTDGDDLTEISTSSFSDIIDTLRKYM